MIGQSLRIEIEAYSARRNDNPMFHAASRGEVSLAMARSYVANLGHMVKLTVPYMRRARDRSLALGNPKLAEYFGLKVTQEEGHVVWAERDVEALATRESERVMTALPLTSSVQDLASWLASAIDENPVLYLSYIAFAEYTTVILGPAWLELLATRCGIPRSSMTIVDNHVELDRDHAEEAFACIDDFVHDPAMLGPMRAALAKTIGFFNAICAEIVAMPSEQMADESQRSVA